MTNRHADDTSIQKFNISGRPKTWQKPLLKENNKKKKTYAKHNKIIGTLLRIEIIKIVNNLEYILDYQSVRNRLKRLADWKKRIYASS